ncbi:MAG: hypothetical protein ACOY3L_12410 [Pseudomonadota bacterium]
MLVPARKLALVVMALAGGLIVSSSRGLADDAALGADRLGVADAVALTDREMSGIRGTGFLNGVTQGLLGTLTASGKAASGIQTSVTGLTGFISALLGVLPPGNTVSAQIGNQPIVTLNGTGPQSLGCGGGITCGPGTSFLLSSSGDPASAHATISLTLH